MSGGEVEHVFPSRANLVAVKVRILSARKGHRLLKQKRDVLELKVRDLKQQQEKLEFLKQEALQDGLMHLARARFYGTKFQPYMVAQTMQAETYLLNHSTRIVGINIPTFHFKTDRTNRYRFTGLAGGKQETQFARQKFLELLELLVSIASIRFSLLVLEPALHQTQTRCNAVQYVVIPKMELTKAYILDSLDEQEREDFYRLKCSKNKQIIHKQDAIRRYSLDHVLQAQDFGVRGRFQQTGEVRSIQEEAQSLPTDPFTKATQTDGVYVLKQVTAVKLTQTGDLARRPLPPPTVLDDNHRIRWKSRPIDIKEKATVTETLQAIEYVEIPERCKGMAQNWKSVQTDE